MNISFYKPCKLNRIQLWDLVKCAFVSCMNECSLRDGRSVRTEYFKLVISNYAALYVFAHCHIHVIFHCVLYAKWVLPWL